MKFKVLFLPLIFLSVFSFSCEEVPNSPIEQALFTDDIPPPFNPELFYNLSITYDTGGDFVPNWGELIGLTMTVNNTLENNITNIVITLTSVEPSSLIEDYSTNVRTISSIGPFGNAIPDGYWCFDCNTSSEIYIGNFYFLTFANTGTSSITVNFSVTFDYEGNNYSQSFSSSISVFN